MSFLQKGELYGEEFMEKKYFQSFTVRPISSVSSDAIVDAYNRGEIDEEDVTLTDFMYMCSMCSEDQILRYAEFKGISNATGRLKRLCNRYILTSFYLSTEKNERLEMMGDRAECFYCIQGGAVSLLSVATDRYDLVWDIKSLTGLGKRVRINCLRAEFFMRCMTMGKYRAEFEKNPIYVVYPSGVPRVFSAFGCVGFDMRNEKFEYIIVDSVSKNMLSDRNRDRLLCYPSFLRKSFWKKYLWRCEGEPVLLLFVDNDDMAFEISHAFMETSRDFDAVMFTTPDRITDTTTTEPFLKYDKMSDTLYSCNYFLFN